jgi:oxygen-dependent protoporphyrinogen oxidase
VRGGRLEVIDPKAVGALTGGDDGPRAGESVAEFFGRKTGPTGTALAEALVTGVYAGDPERLSALHTLGTMLPGSPSVPNLPPSPPVALKGGMITLVERLATGADLRTGERAEMIEPGGRFLVRTSASTFEADRVIVALGPRGLLLLDPTAPRCAEAPVSVMGIGLGLEDLEGTEETNGYGFLCPPSEGRHTLGILFTSAVYPHVAPEGKALWRVFLGGARTPARAGDDRAQALAGALEDIRTLLGLELAPKWVSLLRHPSGIPQPELGHETIIERRAALERTHPGLAFCGLGFEGVAVDQALGSGIAAVRRATER